MTNDEPGDRDQPNNEWIMSITIQRGVFRQPEIHSFRLEGFLPQPGETPPEGRRENPALVAETIQFSSNIRLKIGAEEVVLDPKRLLAAITALAMDNVQRPAPRPFQRSDFLDSHGRLA